MNDRRPLLLFALGALACLAAVPTSGAAETIRVAIGTQDTTINCATGGLLIRELKLLEKHLPKDGRYADVTWDVQWKNFTSGPPLTNEMIAGKLDFGSMADFPGSLNAAAFQKAGKRSIFLTVLSGSTGGSGNGVVVPIDSPVQSLAELKGKQISVPFGSTAHGMLLRAIAGLGWDPEKDVTLVAQSPEVGGSSLQGHKIDAHADFVPFPELFTYRGFARKIFDGSQARTPTFHGSLVNAEFAARYPEVVVAFLQAALEADALIRAEPEQYSELVAKVTGIDAEVVYLFHGPLGLQTRDLSWKPEFRQALNTAIATLKLLKKTDVDLDDQRVVDDRWLRQAYAASGRDYEAQLKDYAKLPVVGSDALTGAPIGEPTLVAQVWLAGEAKVRNYASPRTALSALKEAEAAGQKARVTYVHDRLTGLKVFAARAWYALGGDGAISAFLLKADAEGYAKANAGTVVDFAGAKGAATKGGAATSAAAK